MKKIAALIKFQSPRRFMRRAAVIWLSSAALLAASFAAALPAVPQKQFPPPPAEYPTHAALFWPGTGSPKGLACGYDPRGAEDGWHLHRANAGRLAARAASSGAPEKGAARLTEAGDVVLIEDGGALVLPPNRFDLAKSALLFTPAGDGFLASRADLAFTQEMGNRLAGFTGLGDAPDADDGFREVELAGAPFTFYGITYTSVFVGTNGYLTFGGGETSARPSPSALATELPRIAPLWSDLEVVTRGGVYYARQGGRHVFTWKGARHAVTGGACSFQVSLFDDGRIAFAYKKVKAPSSLVGMSRGGVASGGLGVDLSAPPPDVLSEPFFESFSLDKRLDAPAIGRAFFEAYEDVFDALFIWTDFRFDNGAGFAHSFNVRNDIQGIGLPLFDRGAIYGSAAKLSTVVIMGDISRNWPANPRAHAVGLNSAVSIVCHELGHRWLSYVRFAAGRRANDDLLGRQRAHWSFLMDTRTDDAGSASSLMEGNAWRDNRNGTFTTMQSTVNYFNALDQYLMGLIPAEEVGEIRYLETEADLQAQLRSVSPTRNFTMSARPQTLGIDRIIASEGPRLPDAASAPKAFRVAFLLVTEGPAPPAIIAKVDRYREALVSYFSSATRRRASLSSALTP